MAQEYAAYSLVKYFEEEERMETYRIHRRSLRDFTKPFDIPEDRFVEIYRVDRELARFMINVLKPHLACGQTRRAISAETKILTALNFYGQGSYQKAIGQDHHLAMSQSSVSRCIAQVSFAITTQLANQWIKFPATPSQIALSKQKFYQKFGFPGVIGCIDGTHISIKGPSDDNIRMSYYNRKGYFSINVQIVCGANAEILAINARFPGSVHDAAIWSTCDLRAVLRNSNSQDVWLLGDSGYPLEPWLLTPHENNDSAPRARYNQCHISTRNCVERTIGYLKTRFRCLLKQRELVYKHEAVGNIIYSCAVLHNMCLSRNVALPSENNHHIEADEMEAFSGDLTTGLLLVGRSVREDVIRHYFSS